MIDRPAHKPEEKDLPVLEVVSSFRRQMSEADDVDLGQLAGIVTPASRPTWERQLAEEGPAEKRERRDKYTRLGLLWRQPHYHAADHAEVLMIILHPDDVGLGYKIPEDVGLPGVAIHVLQVDGAWRVHLLHDLADFFGPPASG